MDYLHWYCRSYHVYKFVSLIIEVPNESYLGTITVKAHIIKSEEPSIIQGINYYYYNNTLNSIMHHLDTLYILQKEKLNRFIKHEISNFSTFKF
jgi:hypothetical protein